MHMKENEVTCSLEAACSISLLQPVPSAGFPCRFQTPAHHESLSPALQKAVSIFPLCSETWQCFCFLFSFCFLPACMWITFKSTPNQGDNSTKTCPICITSSLYPYVHCFIVIPIDRVSHYELPKTVSLWHPHSPPTNCLIYDPPRHCLIMTPHPAQPTSLDTVSHQHPLDSVSLWSS